MYDSSIFYRIKDTLDGILDGKDEAGGELQAIVLACVHQRRGVGEELAGNEHFVELAGRLVDVAAIVRFRLGNGSGDAPAEAILIFEVLTILLPEIPLAQHAHGRLGPCTLQCGPLHRRRVCALPICAVSVTRLSSHVCHLQSLRGY